MQLLTFFVVGPVLAFAIALSAWRGKLRGFKHGIGCLASGVTAILLFGFAKWMNADVRTVQYLLQLACVLLSGLLFGVSVGCGFSALLDLWSSHKTTRLKHDN
jgi:threonine/homoserine/homoserine lactone efflux protein